ncbi:MAG: Crp/Fnr family transcriptional regulator [Bacteroidetes bacterium]|jgi:CRP-like cAMP-binding protein|nr:Crp/Fnr family transcriptional regulator [Bacteroidota bacterium]
MQDLILKIKNAVPLGSKAEEYLNSIATEKTVPKGSVLLRQGQRVDNIFFVTSGCLRSYCVDKNGKEHTLHFAIKNNWISDYIAFHGDETATLTIECLQESELIQFPSKMLTGMLSMFPELEPFQRQNLERLFVRLEKRILNQLQLSAAERYELFLEEYPEVEQHARNYHIASYLGITQESLSRIRVEKAKN